MRLVTASEMARLDRITIEEVGVPGIVLMENAGRGAAEFFQQVIPNLLECRITILAGSGNNGGDGFVLARLFHDRGAAVSVVCLRPPEKLKGDALVNFQILSKLQVPVMVWDEAAEFEKQFESIKATDVIVDAILGTGLNSDVRGLFRAIIEAVNELNLPVLAVDVPSGLDASTGKVLGAAIRARATATFGLAKIGQIVDPGEEYVGTLKVIDIGIPKLVLEANAPQRYWMDEDYLSGWLSRRSASVHKGQAGHVGVLSGSRGKTGAATLICEGAAHVGAGLVTLFIPASLNPIVEVKLTEMMTLPIPETEEQSPDQAALPEILTFMQQKQVLAVGPGISLHPGTRTLVAGLLPQAPCPMVLDADALTILADRLELLRATSQPLILTPHPGEMARLIRCSASEVQQNRLAIAAEFSRQWGVTLVLKGHRSIIAAPDGRLAVNGTGNPAMASGGMGDILTGMIAGFLAQGLDPYQAACLGVFVHGASADRRMAKVASRGLLASQILDEIAHVIGCLEGSSKSR
ncbi:NAD(P)H-hydrate dehydratase [Desulfoferrobacter suflitae]|uniref:NAD(P)H-hydrate dehydratase n=1 Tax=Desulfoferrobacter suflitae TaxID=2865782 RepID=UPI002164438B|nr:NAD(P)H-hydrate dehydratase [Desulfoferrobacter suflitae]MCK8601092.1 NAD(P)H-hydrate dehydratase [Desulfoferrobacter suflitae]